MGNRRSNAVANAAVLDHTSPLDQQDSDTTTADQQVDQELAGLVADARQADADIAGEQANELELTDQPTSTEPTSTEPTGTDDPEQDTTPDPIDPAITLTGAYGAAVNGADATTGTIPAVLADPLRVAYRLAGAKRVKLAASLQSASMAACFPPVAEQVDIARLAAINAASQIFADADATRTGSTTPAAVVDPAVQALAVVTALRTLERMTLELLTDDQRASVIAEADSIMDGTRTDYAISWADAGLPTRGGKRAASKRASGTATGAPRASGAGVDLGAMVVAALTTAGSAMTASELNAACDRSGGAVPNACEKLVTAGKLTRTTVTRDSGKQVAAWELA